MRRVQISPDVRSRLTLPNDARASQTLADNRYPRGRSSTQTHIKSHDSCSKRPHISHSHPKMTFIPSLVSSLSTKLGFTSTPTPHTPHPLDPLSQGEISAAVEAIKAHIASQRSDEGYRVWYKSIQLLDAPKAILAPYLDKWHAATESGETIEELDRKAEAIVGVKAKGECSWYGELLLRTYVPVAMLINRDHRRLPDQGLSDRLHI